MSNENNIKIKDPEGREYDDSGSATLKKVISVICVIFSLVGIITNSIYPLTGMKKGGIFLGFTLCLIFLLYPTKIKGRRLLAYDVVLSVMGFGVGLYTFLVTDRFSMSNLQMTTMDTVMSFLAVALVIIAARRAVGNAMAILPVIFSLYALFGRYIPGLLGHGGYTLKRFLMRMYMVDEGLYGMTAQVACSYVFLFIVFGAFLSSSGVAEFFNDASNRIAGARAGGPAKVAVISSGLMGTISGSSAANVATTGVFTIPMMKKVGFSSEFAGASRVRCLHRRHDHAADHGFGRVPDDAVSGRAVQQHHACCHFPRDLLLLLRLYVGALHRAAPWQPWSQQG